MPDEGEDLKEHIQKKYGPGAIRNFGDDSPLSRAGREVGIKFDTTRRIYPTARAHSVIEYLKEKEEKQGTDGKETSNKVSNDMMEELYKRYFEQGHNVNSVKVLQEVGEKFGLDREKVQTIAQDSKRQKDILRKDMVHKRQMNIRGVPFYIIEQSDGSTPVGFSGAHPPDTIAGLLLEAAGVDEN